MSYKELFLGFGRSGLLGYGGGPSVIPLIRYEAVDKYKWMTDDEFGDVLALANALPGPIATKMATYIGYRVKGNMGAAVAVLSHIVPTVIAMIALLGSLYAMGQSAIIKGMIMAVGPVIGMMLAVMAYQFFQKTWKGMGKAGSIATIAVSIVALQFIGIHPAIIIAIFIAFAFIKTYTKSRAAAPLSHQDSMTNRSVEK
ncbi:chromate transporter [Ammoniphilus sp. CFH 90114]|uniref:chromate transporter n=1 Tax=Ammoniphilus sp. CFH 90114 TaxID=2493665 RepID=UPI00100E8AA3|nr:chromate transporter [Ammoniphilus sp. CFH 90114]RXT04852.1 chromate transporter [Ammoniphilus sp. CFH 90114]